MGVSFSLLSEPHESKPSLLHIVPASLYAGINVHHYSTLIMLIILRPYHKLIEYNKQNKQTNNT